MNKVKPILLLFAFASSSGAFIADCSRSFAFRRNKNAASSRQQMKDFVVVKTTNQRRNLSQIKLAQAENSASKIDLLTEADLIFDSIDTNDDGVISGEELQDHLEGKMGYSIESVRYLVNALDIDTDGVISRDEMRFAFYNYEALEMYLMFGVGGSDLTDGGYSETVKQICRSKAASSDPEERNKLLLTDLADIIFDMIERDECDEIDKSELRDHFEKVKKQSTNDDWSLRSVESVFSKLDLNSDGVISREEMRNGFQQFDHRALSNALGIRVYRATELEE